MINKYFLAFFVATALAGCGGSGEDLSTSISGTEGSGGSGTSTCSTDQSAVGFWSGTVYTALEPTNKKETVGVVLPSGKYLFATGESFSSLISGSGSTKCTTFTSGDTFDPNSQSGLIQGTASGTVTSERSINVSFKLNGTPKGSAVLDYEKSYKYEPNINNLFGSRYTNIKDNNKSFVLKEKSFYFTDTDCHYKGTLNSADNIGNSFQLALEIVDLGNCSNSTNPGKLINGNAFLYTKNGSTYLMLLGISEDKKWFSGAFKQGSAQ